MSSPFNDVEAGAGGGENAAANTVADIAGASQDDDAAKLRRTLVAGGVGQAATALYMALFKEPAGLFLWARFLCYSYYIALVAVVLFGVAEAWVGLWVSHDPPRRRAVGGAVLWASLGTVILLAGVGASRL